MRLERLQNFFREKGLPYQYAEEDGLGSIDFVHRGISYHIWEFKEAEYGAESNVRNGGWSEDFFGDYEETLIGIIKDWG